MEWLLSANCGHSRAALIHTERQKGYTALALYIANQAICTTFIICTTGLGPSASYVLTSYLLMTQKDCKWECVMHYQISKHYACTVLVCLLLQGCTDTTVQYYGPVTLPVDDGNELHISTYAAGFPEQEAHIPFLYRKLRTQDQVYFQVLIREKGKEAGPNPNIESIKIRSFSYHFPNQEPIELIADYDDNFWMQGQPNYNPGGSEPIPFNEHWYLHVQLDMSLNGVDYKFDERLDANTRRSVRPLILWALQ